ncbi:MAG TPA: cold shock domain-containing protein [Acidimicrobiales bacterium]
MAPEPDRADGEVRWFLADLGWGVIAHCDGDLWVHFSQIDGVGYRSLDDGEPVTFDVASPRQAKFRRADNVRRISRLEGLV